jgi:FMN phosphatase YigB (HAD superfamily)
MLTAAATVFLLDVDDTLLDNDRFAADLSARLDQNFGAVQRRRYWTIFAELREQLGYADYLASLQKFRIDLADDPQLLSMSEFMLEYPFAGLLYPHALEVIAHLRTQGLPVILSDGDVVFQPHKIRRSGLWDAVDGRVLVYVHKQRMRMAIERHYPARHYVMVDDKAQLLAAAKLAFGDALTTVFVRQGHYAAATVASTLDPAPDLSVDRIGDLRRRALADFLPAGHGAAAARRNHEAT